MATVLWKINNTYKEGIAYLNHSYVSCLADVSPTTKWSALTIYNTAWFHVP
jgi:hypothetical protein